MNSEVRNWYRCFRRVEDFLAAHNFADAPAGLGKQLDELNAVLTALPQGSLEQEAGSRLTKAQTKHQRELRQELWDSHMLPVSRVARDVFGIAGMDKALRMPKVTAPNEAVVSAAGAMAEAAERQQAAFTEHGLAPEFVASLRSAASELATALGARDGTQRRRVEATRAAKQLTKRGKRAVRLLNAILRPRLVNDPSLLEAWDNVRQVKESGGGAAAAPDATTPPGNPAPEPAKQAA